MQTKRNSSEIARSGEVSPQNMQHFMSQSLWSAEAMIEKMRAGVANHPDWTVQTDGTICAATLLIRRSQKRLIYRLTNAAPRLPLETLAFRKPERYFVERSIQDAKSELGWGDLQVIK